MSNSILKSAGPIMALLALTGCEASDIEINGQKGVPLSDIELAGAPPANMIAARLKVSGRVCNVTPVKKSFAGTVTAVVLPLSKFSIVAMLA